MERRILDKDKKLEYPIVCEYGLIKIQIKKRSKNKVTKTS